MKRTKRLTWKPALETLESRRLLSVYGDFNGDGYADLAVGIPEESISFATNCGAVNVIYGSAGGLTSANNLWIFQNGFGGTNEAGDGFGSSLAVGDFNGDSFADLAIGAPYENVGSVESAGAVTIVYGSVNGLTTAGVKVITQDSPKVRDVAETQDRFGSALAAADFDGDGKDDLAVGVSGQSISGVIGAGAVHMLYGSPGGIIPRRNQVFSQDSPGIAEAAEYLDHFGQSLTGGDFNGDGKTDLAIGVPLESISGFEWAGAVHVLYGGSNGISATNSQLVHQDVVGIPDEPSAEEYFGQALVAGDYNGDGRGDLAIGVPAENGDSVLHSGAVHVLFGSGTGLTAVGNQFWTQGSVGMGAVSEDDDYFGFSLAAGNVVGSSHDDLAIGAPFEGVGAIVGAGAVLVLAGSPTGLASTGGMTVIQEDIPGAVSEEYDFFGLTLTVGNFDASGFSEVVIGVPYEDIGAITDCGAVLVYYGSGVGEVWHQDVPGLNDSAEPSDHFGGAVGAGSGGKSHSGGGSGRQRLANPGLAANEILPQPTTDHPKAVRDQTIARIESQLEKTDSDDLTPTGRQKKVHHMADSDLAVFGPDLSLDHLTPIMYT